MSDIKTDLGTIGKMIELLEEAGIEREHLMKIVASSIERTINELDPDHEWSLVIRRRRKE